MSAFKNLLKSGSPTGSSNSSSSRALGGQGSHFQKNDDVPFATPAAEAENLGSTVTGTEPSTVGPADTSAASSSAYQAQATSGPEAGGSSHIGTAPAPQSDFAGDRTAAQPSTSPTSTSYSLPKTLRSNQDTSSVPSANTGTGTGTASVGETVTYSSRPLASGDPTGSVVDHQSRDPLTYKLPEAGSHPTGTTTTTGTRSTSATGATSASPTNPTVNTSSAASKAASLAWSSQNKPPSTLTTTADPVARSAEYSASTDTKGLDSAQSTSTAQAYSQPTPVATTQSQPAEQGIVGRTLGAIGLGGAASTAAGYLGYGNKEDTAEPRDTSAVATQPGLTSQETGPPRHYRRESIPTTAYPGGPNSPRAIAPPIGGTSNVRQSIDEGLGSSTGVSGISNERGIGGTPANVQGVSSSPAFGLGASTSGVPDSQYSETSRLRDNIATGTSGQTRGSETGAYGQDPSNTREFGTQDSHTSRNLAAGGAAAAATGVAAHSLHHHERSDDLRSSAAGDAARQQPIGSREDTLAGGNSYTITGGRETAPVDAISSRDPNSTPAGLGSSTSSAAPIAAVAAAPGRYDGQDYSQSRSTGLTSGTEQGQNSAPYYDAITVAPGSGSTRAAPPGTYGSTSTGQIAPVGSTTIAPSGSTADYSTSGRDVTGTGYTDRDSGRNAGLAAAGTAAAGGAAYAVHEHSNDRDLEKQREADAKEAAKREKAHEKELEHERSRAEKEEKKHQKEIEKEEKKHDKEEREAAHAAEKREHARLAAEEEDRKRREREAAAGVGGAGVGTAAAGAHHDQKEKKPSIFKRIFRRRKNKDTGEDEDYSTDDEDDKARHGAAGSSVPIHHSEDKGRNVLGSTPGNTLSSSGPAHPVAEEQYGRSAQAGAATVPYSAVGVTAGLGETSRAYGSTEAGTTGLTPTGADGRPVDSHTGLAYDSSRDPAAASRLSGQDTGEYAGTGTGGHILGSEPLGEIGDTRR